MPSISRFQFALCVFSLGLSLQSVIGQVTTATLAAGTSPNPVAVNTATNKIYVTNLTCANIPCPGPGTVTVIDGTSNISAAVTVGVYPYAIAVNQVTNKIYVANSCGNDLNCQSLSTVTVIDGATNNTSTVTAGVFSNALAVNSATNRIYVSNSCGNDFTCSSLGTITVIDGATNNTSTVNSGNFPEDVEVNSVTNKIYVVNNCGADNSCGSTGTVTVIDGVSNNTLAVNVGAYPYFAAVNSVTNQIYVSNACGNDLSCSSLGTVTAINGATNSTVTINAGADPYGIAVNAQTNKIYAVNTCGNDLNCGSAGSVTSIDGATNNTTQVAVGVMPNFVAVDPATNKIYVPNSCGYDLTCVSAGTVTVIDGTTNTTLPVAVGDEPFFAGINATTDTIYVPNYLDGTVSVIAGDTALQFVSVTPCRLVDTRKANGTFGGPPIQGNTYRSFPIPESSCGIPPTASAYSLNVTLVPDQGSPVGFLTVWPSGENRPIISTMNSQDGRFKANAALLSSGVGGAVSVYSTDTTDVVLDIDGYFASTSSSTLEFYPLTPCRVADTRKSNFPQGLGAPHLMAGVARDFPVLESSCIPSGITPAAYSFNFTAVPYPSLGAPLAYLELWPKGQQPQSPVSTLNNQTGTYVANAAILPAGTSGDVTAYASNDTDIVIDVDGYFAPAGQGGLSLYPAVPCRVIDTRKNGSGQPFSGTLSPPVDVKDSVCAPSSTAQAFVLNATVVPVGFLSYLTLWPDGETQPVVSTLNAADGAITSNMAIVPTSNGKVDAFADGVTQLILDISSYFAP